MGLPKEDLPALLLYSFAVGALLGVLWDIFRIIRLIVCNGRSTDNSFPIRLPASEREVTKALSFKHRQKVLPIILIFISDLLFCLFAAVSVILLLFHLNGGQIRGFVLFGAALGAVIYYFTVGKLTFAFSDRIIRGAKRLIRFILSVTVIPVFGLLKELTRSALRKLGLRIRKRQTLRYVRTRIKDAEMGFGLLNK